MSLRVLVWTSIVLLGTSCGLGVEDPSDENDDPPAAAPDREAAPAATPIGHHRGGAPLDFAEAASLLPSVDDASTLTAPRLLPQERMLAEYCHFGGELSARAEALASSLETDWSEVSVQEIRDRRIIRASRGEYVLRATLGPGTGQRCSGSEALLVRILVFKPQGPGGQGRMANRRQKAN